MKATHTHTISIDPDTSTPGVALFLKGALRQAFAHSVDQTCEQVTHWLENGHDTWGSVLMVVECPQTYGGRASGNADANDLINLARVVGRFEEVAFRSAKIRRQDVDVLVVTPSQWKGQTPKHICTQRAWDALTPAERNEHLLEITPQARASLLKGNGIKSGKSCDVMDAVALGLRALGRTPGRTLT